MGVRIQYMGTKQQLADEVREVIDDLRPGRPVLDLFCGMCSVAGALADSDRAVWGNDIQKYASHAASCVIGTSSLPPHPAETAELLAVSAERNATALRSRFSAELEAERNVLADPSVETYKDAYDAWKHAGNDAVIAAEISDLRTRRGTRPYRLATLTFAWGYFGLEQAIHVDSLRYAIDHHRRRGDLTPADRDWALLALLQASSRLATGPGHLAQYLAASTESSLERVVRQRTRDMTRQFEIELGMLSPYGTPEWRHRNVVLSRDALQIWPALRDRDFRGNVIYADPPYSINQYSRFYHVLETLHRYDYPPSAGRGRYRPDRFSTGFSSRVRVAGSFRRLSAGAARLDCALVLSYPSNGVLVRYGKGDVEAILRERFRRVTLATRTTLAHSTLGGAHGDRDNEVEEVIYVALP